MLNKWQKAVLCIAIILIIVAFINMRDDSIHYPGLKLTNRPYNFKPDFATTEIRIAVILLVTGLLVLVLHKKK